VKGSKEDVERAVAKINKIAEEVKHHEVHRLLNQFFSEG
jgi:hypothetical protein